MMTVYPVTFVIKKRAATRGVTAQNVTVYPVTFVNIATR